ncbi:MAG: hypothetical protein OXG62_00300, partial [Nitrospinae bacterium]|nr:hypothetical protein [Nitrospinota bacterium]
KATPPTPLVRGARKSKAPLPGEGPFQQLRSGRADYSSLSAPGQTRHTSMIEPTMPLGAGRIVMMKNRPMTRIARSVYSPGKSLR